MIRISEIFSYFFILMFVWLFLDLLSEKGFWSGLITIVIILLVVLLV